MPVSNPKYMPSIEGWVRTTKSVAHGSGGAVRQENSPQSPTNDTSQLLQNDIQ